MNEQLLETGESGAGLGLDGVAGLQEILMKGGSPFLNLQKALEAGYATSPDTMQGGGAFRIESLESAITNLIFTEQSTVMANDLLASKEKADNTVLQFSTLDDIGEAYTYEEGGAPAEEDDDYSRKYKLVKYIGAIGVVTNVLLATNNLVSAREEKIRRKNMAIKRKLDQLAYFGDSSLVSTEFDGLMAEVQNAINSGLGTSSQIVDLRGKRPMLESFNEGVNAIENVAGSTGNLRLYMSPTSYKNFLSELMAQKRFFINGRGSQDVDAEIQGLKLNRLVHYGGEAEIRRDMFLNARKFPRRNTADNAFIASGDKAPATPTITSVTPTADAASLLTAATYDYAVVAVNKYGHKSVPQETNGADIVIGSGQKAVFTVVDGGSTSGQEATAFEVYRRDSASTDPHDYRYLFTAKAGATFADSGQTIPDTDTMFLIEWSKDVLVYKQLLDLTLFPLATTVDSIRWLQRLYGTLMVKNPRRVVVFKNVGSIPN